LPDVFDGLAEGRQKERAVKQFLGALASVIGGEAVLRAVNVAASVYIARFYGTAVLGAYAGCLAVVTAVVLFADNGLQTFAITELSGTTSNRSETAGRIYLSKTILLGIALLLLAAIAAFLKLTSFLWALSSLVTVRVILQSYSQLQIAFLKARLKAGSVGGIQILHSLYLLIGIGLTAARAWSLFLLLAWFASGQLVESLLTWIAVRRAGLHPSFPAKMDFWSVARRSLPFGIAYGFANLIVRLDVIILSFLVPLSVLGAFSAANSVLLIVYLAAWLFGSLLLPEMLRLSSAQKELAQYVRTWTRVVWMVSLPAILLAYLGAPKIVVRLYGPSFVQSGALTSIMVLAIPFILMNAVYTSLAIATHRKTAVVALLVTTAAATILLDFIAGRFFGPAGVAEAMVIREAALFFGLLLVLSRRHFSTTELEYNAAS
jgi:O-antigen/teichoic acid export membrane protein